MEEENIELITYQNHTRVLQIENILNNAVQWISEREKNITDSTKARALLQMTPPLIIDIEYPQGSKRDKLFSEADEGFKTTFEEGFVLQILSEIERAVDERASATTYIDIDKPNLVYPAVNIIYRGREKKLGEVRDEGFLRGRTKLLPMMSGEVRL